jgi:hypothetical protein
MRTNLGSGMAGVVALEFADSSTELGRGSNPEIKRVYYGSEDYEGEEGLAALLVASADTAATFDAGEEIFDYVAMSISELGIVILDLIRLPWWDTGSRAEADEFFAKGLRIEASVREDEASGEFIRQQFYRFEVVPVTGRAATPSTAFGAYRRPLCTRS